MHQTLFEVDAADPTIYVGLSVHLLLVAEGASWVPARRATHIDPVIARRGDRGRQPGVPRGPRG